MQSTVIEAGTSEPRGSSNEGKASSQRPKGDIEDRVYTELRRRLMVGHFLPGDSITLRVLARELGVSPMPVRSALKHLIAEGGIEMLPNRTIRVPFMTYERLLELLQARRELEGMAAVQACRNMSDADLRGIESAHKKVMSSLKAGDVTQALSLNQQFHFAIYAAARSWVLMPMIETLWLRAGPFMHWAQASAGIIWDGRHHRDIIRALKFRDADAARNAVRRDITLAGQNLRQIALQLESSHSSRLAGKKLR